MVQRLPRISHEFSYLIMTQTCKVGTIIPLLEMRKLRLRVAQVK